LIGIAMLVALVPLPVIAVPPGKEAERPASPGGLESLLPLMERLSLYPVETLLAVQGSSVSAVLALQGLSRQLALEAQPRGDEQTETNAAADGSRQEVPGVGDGKAARQRREDASDNKIAGTQRTEARAAERGGPAGVAGAGGSHAALAAPERPRKAPAQDMDRPDKQKRFADGQTEGSRQRPSTAPATAGALASSGLPHGHLLPPLTGGAVRRSSGKVDDGRSNGVTYSAPPGAHVIAPCGGRVVFANTFRTYGLLLILDCGGGYNVVLSGLDRLDVKLGEVIVAGERVGVMPMWAAGLDGHRQALYVELRRNGTPVDPTRWMRPSG
jgi:septal ring factor EnvC (AmiA/AmiB activator)